ncbi:MAG: radical SAM/SPASM domain-containing protein [Vulcanimicrobiota bacterium]
MQDWLRDLRFALGVLFNRPFNCLLQVTNRCNMKCSFCDFWPNTDRDHELSLDHYRRLASELGQLGNFLISIEGGEPFVRQDLVEIVGAFSDQHIPTLFTNGWYVTAENARALFEAGLGTCCISIDYPDPERHDAKRCLPGAFERAWQAVDRLRAAAPRGGKQVAVMSVVMEDNWRDLEALLELSHAHGVGHQFTLLSTGGFRRGRSQLDQLPGPEAAEALLKWWRRYPHLRYFGDYFRDMHAFLGDGELPTCRAGVQSFNIDHVGNVAACIERIDTVYGNVKDEALGVIHARMVADRQPIEGCQQCWTACRGMAQALGQRGRLTGWRDLATRLRTT